jgi:hypothetical protein
MKQEDLFATAADPLRFPCTYSGFRYALPCGAKVGEPCRWPRTVPPERFHAERRAAAGEPIKTYEERFGHEGGAALEPVVEELGDDELTGEDEPSMSHRTEDEAAELKSAEKEGNP